MMDTDRIGIVATFGFHPVSFAGKIEVLVRPCPEESFVC
jgi:hypothetical protein